MFVGMDVYWFPRSERSFFTIKFLAYLNNQNDKFTCCTSSVFVCNYVVAHSRNIRASKYNGLTTFPLSRKYLGSRCHLQKAKNVCDGVLFAAIVAI